MTYVITDYLEAKYGGGGPDSDRFDPEPGEVHSSRISNCQRQYYYKFKRNYNADPSPYFELGTVFELLYGGALANAHDPEVTSEVLNRHAPWDVAERSRMVVQDVNVEVEIPNGIIVGEADWVVLEEPLDPGEDQPSFVELDENGKRFWVDDSGDGHDGDPPIAKVVETKTKGDLKWLEGSPVPKHIYQVMPYMKAMGVPGEIAYMTRDDWQEEVMELELTEDRWLDVVIRAQQHVQNVLGEELPPTTPLKEKACDWCDFSQECRREGGSVWG